MTICNHGGVASNDVLGIAAVVYLFDGLLFVLHRMFVFGGWVPVNTDQSNGPYPNMETEWRCTNSVACLNLGKWSTHIHHTPAYKNTHTQTQTHTRTHAHTHMDAHAHTHTHLSTFSNAVLL